MKAAADAVRVGNNLIAQILDKASESKKRSCLAGRDRAWQLVCSKGDFSINLGLKEFK